VDSHQEIEQQLREEILSRFPKDSLLEVRFLWRIAGDPESETVNPNALHVRLIPRGPQEYNPFAADIPGRGKVPSEVYRAVVNDFRQAHEATIKQLGKDLASRLGQQVVLSVSYEGFSSDWQLDPPLTPVMARLDRTDLETLDALIAAGCAPNRADAIRWALARVRERPAYGKLVDRVREIQALRAEL
jgi:hypothetical protein